MLTIYNVPVEYAKFDIEFFERLKEIVKQLVLSKPEKRMKLQDARKKLDELEEFTNANMIDFISLNQLFQNNNLYATDRNFENSVGLMNDIRSTRLFTIQTIGDGRKLNQRSTNLCVTVSAMRLLSFALNEFLEQHFTGPSDILKKMKDKILKYQVIPESSKKISNDPNFHQFKKEPSFIRQLIIICCGVISPRSLNGLNHCYLDYDFQIAAQEQNIRK